MSILVNYGGLENADSSVQTVRSKFEEEMANLTSIVEATTEHDWIGPDATTFVNNTKEKLSKVQHEYDDFLKQLSNEIMNNHDKFKETQQHNISVQG